MNELWILWVFGKTSDQKIKQPSNFMGCFLRSATAEIRAEVQSYNLCRGCLAWTKEPDGTQTAENEFCKYVVKRHVVASSTFIPDEHESVTTINKQTQTQVPQTTIKPAPRNIDLWTEEEWKHYRTTGELPKHETETENERFWRLYREDVKKKSNPTGLNWNKRTQQWEDEKEEDGVQDEVVVPASNPPSDSGIPAAPAVQISSAPWKPHAS